MKYTEGTSIERVDASWLKVSITLDDADFVGLLREWHPEVDYNVARAPLGLEYDCMVYLAQKFVLVREVKELQEGPQPPNQQRASDLMTRMKRLAEQAATLKERVAAEVPLAAPGGGSGDDPWTGS